MHFGVLQFFSWPGRRVPLETVYERALQRVDIMDQNGYDAVWLAEHHFTTYSVCPSVHLMGMHIAGRTKNIRIGTAVSLAPLYHPMRLAEEVALLDVLSGGRVNWGAGRGFDANEFKTFGVPAEESTERFREAVEIVLAAWQNEKISWQGKYWNFEEVEVLPKPLQKPHPPHWVAASSLPAIDWAGQNGHSIMMDPHSTHEAIAEKRARYQGELEAHGHSIKGRQIPIGRLIACAPTDKEAEDIARAGAGWTVDAYVNEKSLGAKPGQANSTGFASLQGGDPVQNYLDSTVLHGSPEKLVDQLQALEEEIPLDYLLCSPLSHSSFTLFTEKVLPRFL